MSSHLRLADANRLDESNDTKWHYRTGLQTWLVYWLLWLLLRAEWGDEVVYILDYWRNGRVVHFFPLDARGYQRLLKLTKIDQAEAV